MAKRKKAKTQVRKVRKDSGLMQKVGWLVLAVVALGGWYWYQNYYSGQELDIYEAKVALEPRRVIQEWNFDNTASAWKPVNFGKFEFSGGLFSGLIQGFGPDKSTQKADASLEINTKEKLTPTDSVYILKVILKYSTSGVKPQPTMLPGPTAQPKPSSMPKPSGPPLTTQKEEKKPAPTSPALPTPSPKEMVPMPSYKLIWEVLDAKKQVITKVDQEVTASDLTQIELELPMIASVGGGGVGPHLTEGITLRLYPAFAANNVTVTIDKITLEGAKLSKPTPSPVQTVTVTGRLTKPKLEGQTYYQLNTDKGKSYILMGGSDRGTPNQPTAEMVKKPKPTPVLSWDQYVGKSVTVTGHLYSVSKETVGFMPSYDRIWVTKIAPVVVKKPSPTPKPRRPEPSPTSKIKSVIKKLN